MQSLKIAVEALRIPVSVGIYDAEKQARQDIIVSAQLSIADSQCAIDDMRHSIDYDHISDEIKRVAQVRHYELIENMALHIAQALKALARADKVTVRIDKPLAAEKNGAKTIYVELTV